jgi:hypothetical protein
MISTEFFAVRLRLTEASLGLLIGSSACNADVGRMGPAVPSRPMTRCRVMEKILV